MTRISLALPLTLLALTTGCVDDASDLGSDTAGIIVKDGNNDPCPKLGCGTNSAHVGPAEFHELDESGVLANAEGFRIDHFEKNGLHYKLDVTGTTLTGKLYWFGSWVTALSGSNLVGSKIMVLGPPNDTMYEIRIENVASQQMWQAPLVAIETYELTWRFPGQNFAGPPPRVCVNPPNRKEGEQQLWNSVTEAILFTGDRYDTSALTVDSVGPSSWFNIACAGTVMAKLALNRHTEATETASFPTTKAKRQAMMKMYTSDVCGNGDPLTVTGTPLRWWSTTGMASPAISYNTMEARWDENGAQCLDVHRLHGSANDMTTQITASCAEAGRPVPPPCSVRSPGYDFRTASPAL
ncbi:MAG: ADYC domain-containing protein [Kofleriaceae bacterium]